MALILVAEDTPDLAGLLRDILQSRGHQVALAADGVEMIEKAKTISPKLIIADIMMPGAYGSAAYKTLQEDAHTKGIPIIFLTAVSPDQAAKVVPSAPHVRLLHKPVDIMVLVTTVKEMLAIDTP